MHKMLPCGFSDVGYFKPDRSGHQARRGAFIIQSRNHSPLCKSIRKHPGMIAVIKCVRVPCVQLLVGSTHGRETLAILTEVR